MCLENATPTKYNQQVAPLYDHLGLKSTKLNEIILHSLRINRCLLH